MRLCKLQLSHVYAVPREITIKFTLGTTWVVMVRPGIRAQGGIPNGRGLMTLLLFFEAESCRFEFHDGINVPYFNCFLILTTLAANYCNESTKTFTTESNLTSTIAQLLLRDLVKYARTMKPHKNLSRCNYCDYISNTEMQVWSPNHGLGGAGTIARFKSTRKFVVDRKWTTLKTKTRLEWKWKFGK